MSVATNTSQIGATLLMGLDAVITEMNQYEDQWKKIFTTRRADQNVVTEAVMKMLGPAQLKPEGAGSFVDSMSQRYLNTFYFSVFSIGFIITREAVRDGLYHSQFPLATQAMRASLREIKNVNAANVFNNSFDPDYPIGDGQPLCSLVHPLENGFLANKFATPAQLNETSIEQAIIRIQQFRNEAGLLCNTSPVRLIIPPSLQFQATRLIESRFRTGTTMNDISAINHMNIFPEGYVVNNFLVSPYAWWIQTNDEANFKYFERDPIETDVLTDMWTRNLQLIAFERYCFGASGPRCVFGSEGA